MANEAGQQAVIDDIGDDWNRELRAKAKILAGDFSSLPFKRLIELYQKAIESVDVEAAESLLDVIEPRLGEASAAEAAVLKSLVRADSGPAQPGAAPKKPDQAEFAAAVRAYLATLTKTARNDSAWSVDGEKVLLHKIQIKLVMIEGKSAMFSLPDNDATKFTMAVSFPKGAAMIVDGANEDTKILTFSNESIKTTSKAIAKDIANRKYDEATLKALEKMSSLMVTGSGKTKKELFAFIAENKKAKPPVAGTGLKPKAVSTKARPNQKPTDKRFKVLYGSWLNGNKRPELKQDILSSLQSMKVGGTISADDYETIKKTLE